MMNWLILPFALGLVTLGGEALVRGASMLALRLGVSPLFVGLTIVGFGTSSPELAASVAATLEGSSDVAVGNVIGSNIFNVGVIVGITALIYPIRVQLSEVKRDLLVAIFAAVVPLVALGLGSTLPRAAGVLLVLALFVYLVVAYRGDRAATPGDAKLAEEEVRDTMGLMSRPFLERTWVNLGFVIVGLAMLIWGSRVFVASAITLARSAGVSQLLIGLTIVSAGTSLPELVTSVVAGARRNPDIAVGNIIGSNIFNVLGTLGVSAVLRPQSLAPPVLAFDVPVMIVATLALLPIMSTHGRISRREGVVLLAGYGAYLAILIVRG